MKTTDVHHITVAGTNPHAIASAMGKEDSPFYDGLSRPGVVQHIIVDGQL